ncbi:MAG: hypothetical protein OXE52_20265 [Chloroflexi bacterium]|nr:hypothetical protein [Chloroflexota bacterium]
MKTSELLSEIQQLDRNEKLKILQFLSDDLSTDIEKHFEGRKIFKVSPSIRATDDAITMLETLEEDQQKNE